MGGFHEEMGYDEGNGNDGSDSTQVSGTLTVHSCFVAEPPHSELEHSGCVVVPPAVLQAATARHAAFPLVLRLAGPRPGDAACCLAPLAFTAPDGIVYVPPWVLERLAVGEGDRVRFETVALPKGTAATFALLGRVPPFFDANTLRPQLLAALAHYPCLSVGDKIELHSSSLPSLPSAEQDKTVLEVTAVEAGNGDSSNPITSVSIVDVDLAVSIVVAAQDGSSGSGTGRDRVVAVGSSVRDTLAAGASATFAVDLAPVVRVGTASEGVVLTAGASDVAGDPDLYVSLASTSPSPADFDWCDQAPGNFARVVVPLRDIPPDQQRLFVTVTFYVPPDEAPSSAASSSPSAAMQYELAAEYDDDITSSGNTTSSSEESTNIDDGVETVECPNCHRRVPEVRATLHRVQCARYTYYCAACARAMPRSQRAKHTALCHTPRPCPLCGALLEQTALPAHRAACPQRRAPCPFLCGALVPAAALAEHERTCGARTVVCAHCGLRTRWGVFQRHLVHEHGISDCILERDVKP